MPRTSSPRKSGGTTHSRQRLRIRPRGLIAVSVPEISSPAGDSRGVDFSGIALPPRWGREGETSPTWLIIHPAQGRDSERDQYLALRM